MRSNPEFLPRPVLVNGAWCVTSIDSENLVRGLRGLPLIPADPDKLYDVVRLSVAAKRVGLHPRTLRRAIEQRFGMLGAQSGLPSPKRVAPKTLELAE